MNSILDKLSSPLVWEEFYQYKIERRQLNRNEEKELHSFISEQRYLNITDVLCFSYPEKKLISKIDSKKKRTVYSYTRDETLVLKLLA